MKKKKYFTSTQNGFGINQSEQAHFKNSLHNTTQHLIAKSTCILGNAGSIKAEKVRKK